MRQPHAVNGFALMFMNETIQFRHKRSHQRQISG